MLNSSRVVCRVTPSYRAMFGSLALAALASCGGETSPAIVITPPPARVDLFIPAEAVTKVRAGGRAVAFLQEQLVSIFEQGPRRTLEILAGDGRAAHAYVAPDGWSVVDFAVHPSGKISAVLTTLREARIVQLSPTGSLLSDQPFLDAESPADPFYNYEGGVHDDTALQPALMRDAARVVALEESLVLVLRTGRNAVVAYRLDPDARGWYTRAWRTLVEPGSSIFGKALIGGTFDVFGQLDNHVRVFVDVDAAGVIAIGLENDPWFNFTFRAHTEYFGEPLIETSSVFLTRLAGIDGRRLGSTAIDTHARSELHVLRATARGFVLAGRVLSETRADGTGWNAFVARVGRDGSVQSYQVLDIDRGDVLFDVTEIPGAGYLALGATGYVQNPSGASISESSQALLIQLDPNGSNPHRLDFAGGARHNQLRTIIRLDDRWLLGGMTNGPGTHSGDTQRELIFADGFLRQPPGLPDD
jgi:hypothetical protein